MAFFLFHVSAFWKILFAKAKNRK